MVNSLSQSYVGKRVLVTGGASFIGYHLSGELIKLGCDVAVVDDLSSGRLENLHPEASFTQLDLRESQSAVCDLFNSISPSVVFHLAAVHGGRGFIESFPELMLPNLAIDNNVFNACIRSGVEMVVHASSACAYPIGLQSDTNVLNNLAEIDAGFDAAGKAFPDGVYGWVKLVGELQLENSVKNSRITRGRSARIFTAYGERENESHAAIALIAKSLLKLDPFPVWGDGQQTRNFTYVGDTVTGLLILGADDRKISFDVLNVGSSHHVRVIDFIKEVHNLLSWRPTDFLFEVDKPVGVAARASNNKKFLATFGWEPHTPLSLGIQNTLNWYSVKSDRPKTIKDLEETLMARG